MPLAYRSMVIPTPIDKVWTAVRQFNGLPDWHPAIASSELDSGQESEVGAVRRLTLGDGGVVVERLVELDEAEHRLVYEILESPFAARQYVATMRLAPVTADDATFMEWSAEFDCDAADESDLLALFGDGVFHGGLSGLRDHVA